MAKIFLDTNFVIDLFSRNKSVYEIVRNQELYTSSFSILVVCYIQKIKIPSENLLKLIDNLKIIDLGQAVILRGLSGPTNDLEDNIQLHSASESECDMFLTNDKNLLKMKFFGKMRMASTI